MTNYLAFSVGDKDTGITSITLPGGSGVDTLLKDPNVITHFFQTLITILMVFAVLLAFGFFIFEGFRYMTSHGNKEEVEKAQGALVNSVLGLIIVFIAFFVIFLVGYFFNIQLLHITLLSK